jgi:hypothetical protein
MRGTITSAAAAVVAVLLGTGLSGCSKSAPAPAAAPAATANPMSAIQSAVPGLTEQQAKMGVGGILGYAKTKMPADQYAKAASAFPGSAAMVSEAGKLGMPSEMTGLSSLTGTLKQAGISQEQFEALMPAVTDAVSQKAGPDVAQAFRAAFK